jgi:hypothetical protein
MLCDLPDDVLKMIEFHAIMIFYREKLGDLLDELTFQKTTDANTFGCVFLNLTNFIPELDRIEYGGGYVERIPPLEPV